MEQKKLHYGWIVIFMGLATTVAAHGFGRMAYTIILPAMKDGLKFDYTQLGLLGTGNFIGYLSMAIIGGFLAARFGTRIVITFALILMGVSMILTGLADSFGFAFSMRLLTGRRNRSRYFNIRSDRSTDSKRFWAGRLAFFMVYFRRCCAGNCRCHFFIYPQPAGTKRVASGGEQ